MLRMAKAIVVWTVVILMAVDPASACRFRRYACSPCYTYSYCPPVSCEPSCGYVVYDDGCDGAPVDQAQPAQRRPNGREEMPTPPPQPRNDVRRPETEAEMPQPSLPKDEMPEPEAPAEKAPETPATEPGGPAPVTPPAEEAPETPVQPEVPEPAAPETPAPEATPPAEPPKPAPAPPAESDVDDLFDEEGGAGEAAAPAPAEQPAAEQAKPEEPAPEQPAAEEPKPEVKKPAAGDEVDDLFDEPAEPEKKAASQVENQFRMWTDNTGNYHVRARILKVLDGKVRLLKETGRTTTVPFNRLSKGDLAIVEAYAANAARLAQTGF